MQPGPSRPAQVGAQRPAEQHREGPGGGSGVERRGSGGIPPKNDGISWDFSWDFMRLNGI